MSLQPYLARKGDVRVERGSFDLNLKSEVRNNQLDGKGKVILLDLAPCGPGLSALGADPSVPGISELVAGSASFITESSPVASLNETVQKRRPG